MRQKSTGARALKLVVVLGVATLLMLAMVGPAAADGPTLQPDGTAIRMAPASDCAVITKMAGFPTVKANSVLEPIALGNEGVVIRQSYIKDGKIIIPPQGLYYTVRTGSNRWPIVNYPVMLLGKTYYLANDTHSYVTKKDFTVKLGEAVPYGGNFSALELSSTETSWGSDSLLQGATFQVLKPSGNYYGSTWQVKVGGPETRSAQDALAQKPMDGLFYQADPLASTGDVYLLAKAVTKDSATVAEWVTNEVMTVDLATKAYTATLAVGETFDLGTYKAKLTALDATAGTANVQILDGTNVVAEKNLGPLTDKVLPLLATDDTNLAKMLLQYKDVQVALSAFTKPFQTTGKVAFVGYSGITRTTMGQPFAPDPRFVVFHDT